MRVLILTSTVDPKSGWGRYSRGIVEALLKQGIKVVLFTEQPVHDLPLEQYRLAPRMSRLPVFSFVRNIFAIRRVADTVDIVHALDGWPFGVYGYLAVAGKRKRFFVNGVGTYSVAPLYTNIKGWLLRRAYRRAQNIFCISRFVRDEMAAAVSLPGKLEVVHMGTVELPVLSAGQIDAYRAQYDAALERFPILLTVGAIKDRKGQKETLAAAALLQKKYPNLLYIAAGAGNQKRYIDAMKAEATAAGMSENLLVIENASDEVLSFLYSIATVVALNSNTDKVHHHFEGFGLVIIEACQFGKPAVGSKDSGIEDAIEDGVSGLLAEQENPEDIADKIEQILNKYEFYSNNAKMRYSKFSWEKTVSAYIEFYNR